MQLTENWGPFRFLSYREYHHHLAINLAGHRAAPVSKEVAGLASFSITRYGMETAPNDPSGVMVAEISSRSR
jgi:catechol-2,3-dioxygenase